MTVLCPKCKSEEFYFVQECTEHHTMEAIYENGNIDLYALEASHPHEENHLYCEHCEWEGSLKQYFSELKNTWRRIMANHTYIEKTVFTNPHTKSKYYGYRMFDDFASMYHDSMDRKMFMKASSLDIARYAYRNGNDISSDMFEDAANQNKPIYVNDLPFFAKDWKGGSDE